MRLFLAVVLVLASVQMASAQAVISSVSAQPGEIRVNPNGASTVRLRWRVTLTFTGPLAETIVSPSGLTSSGTPLGGPLSRTVPSTGGTATVVLAESLFVDRTTAEDIARLGGVTYNRVFAASASTGTGSVPIRPSSGGALALRNLDLSFDDGSRSRVVAPGTALTAQLEVSSVGRGQFAGTWEISGPAGSLAFRPFGQISRRLAGARRTIFESPPLRTDQPGLYRVRFVPDRARSGTGRAPVREILYTVARGAEDGATAGAAAGIRLISPDPGVNLSGAVRFSWQPVPGAARYRVEFSSPAASGFDANALAAVEVEGASVRLKGFTVARLASAERLSWQVTAYDGAGRPLARSPLRSLR